MGKDEEIEIVIQRLISNTDIAAKRRKKHKNQISGIVNSMRYNEQKSNFRLFTSPSIFNFQFRLIRVRASETDKAMRRKPGNRIGWLVGRGDVIVRMV